MPALILALATLSGLLLAEAQPALASCAAPATLAENAARAVAVVHGTVTATTAGAATVRVDRVLKGAVAPTITVFLGPARPAGAVGIGAVSSVDYPAKVGTEHVFYAIRGDDGQLETNACIGSHPGAPSADENAYFGAAGSPPETAGPPAAVDAAATTPAPEAPAVAGVGAVWPLLSGLIIVAVSLVAALQARRARTRLGGGAGIPR